MFVDWQTVMMVALRVDYACSLSTSAKEDLDIS